MAGGVVYLMNVFLVIRIRGQPNVRYDIKETLKRLRLHRKFHATLVPDDPIYRNMLFKVKDYVAYGPVDKNIVKSILAKRGRITGNKPLTSEYIKKNLGLELDELAEKIVSGELKLNFLKGIKPIFRLNPPKGGFKRSTKKLASYRGELGYRDDMNKLVLKML